MPIFLIITVIKYVYCSIISPLMVAFHTSQKLCLRLVACSCLHKPVISLVVPAFWAFYLRLWQCLYILVNDFYLVFVIHSFFYNHALIFAFLVIALAAFYAFFFHIRKQYPAAFWAKHHFIIPPNTSLNK